MAVNKVVYDGTTLVDLTEDTVTPDSVLPGETFHLASGARSSGTLTNGKLGIAAGSTSSTTSPLSVTSGDYALREGGIICIYFEYECPASAQINVDSTGAKSILYQGSALPAGVICDGDKALFMYSGSSYHLLSIDKTATLILDSELTALETALRL